MPLISCVSRLEFFVKVVVGEDRKEGGGGANSSSSSKHTSFLLGFFVGSVLGTLGDSCKGRGARYRSTSFLAFRRLGEASKGGGGGASSGEIEGGDNVSPTTSSAFGEGVLCGTLISACDVASLKPSVVFERGSTSSESSSMLQLLMTVGGENPPTTAAP